MLLHNAGAFLLLKILCFVTDQLLDSGKEIFMIANTAAKSKAAENIAISPKELKKLAMCRKSFEFSRMGLTYDGTKEVLFSVKAVNEVKNSLWLAKRM